MILVNLETLAFHDLPVAEQYPGISPHNSLRGHQSCDPSAKEKKNDDEKKKVSDFDLAFFFTFVVKQ